MRRYPLLCLSTIELYRVAAIQKNGRAESLIANIPRKKKKIYSVGYLDTDIETDTAAVDQNTRRNCVKCNGYASISFYMEHMFSQSVFMIK